MPQPELRTITRFLPSALAQRLGGENLATLIPRFSKWGVTGTLTVALDVLLFRALYPATDSVFIANAIGTPIVTGFNYLMHHNWSFEATRSHKAATSRYLVTLLFGYLLNSTIVKLALLAGAPPTLAKLAAVPIQAPINFVILNRWVFHSRPKSINTGDMSR